MYDLVKVGVLVFVRDCVCVRVCLMTTLLSVVKSSIRLLWLFVHRLRSGPALKEWIFAPSPGHSSARSPDPASRGSPSSLTPAAPILPTPLLLLPSVWNSFAVASFLISLPSCVRVAALFLLPRQRPLSLSLSRALFFYSSFHHPPPPLPHRHRPLPIPPHPSLSPSLHFASAF